MKTGHFSLRKKNIRNPTNLVETGDDVAEIDPRRPSFCHLVKQVIPEKLQEVSVPCLRPGWVLLKPKPHNATSQFTYTTMSLTVVDINNKCYLLRSLVNCAQFGQQAEEASILHLLNKDKNVY